MYHKSTWEYFFFFLSGNHECFVCIPNFSEGLLITPIISRTSLVIDSRQSRAGLLLVTGTKDPFSDGHKRPFLVKHMQMAQSPEDKFSGLTFALFKG